MIPDTISLSIATLAIGAGLVRLSKCLLFLLISVQLTSLALHFFPMRGDHASILYFAAPAGFCLASQSFPGVDLGLFEAIGLGFKFMFVYTLSALLATGIYRVSPFHPLASYPGPWLWHLSSLRLAYISYLGKRHLILDDLHRRYGPFVRIGRLFQCYRVKMMLIIRQALMHYPLTPFPPIASTVPSFIWRKVTRT